MIRSSWTVVYKPEGKARERRDVSAPLFESALGAAIELQWEGAEICRILGPDGMPLPEDRYAAIIWKRPCLEPGTWAIEPKPLRKSPHGAPRKRGARQS